MTAESNLNVEDNPDPSDRDSARNGNWGAKRQWVRLGVAIGSLALGAAAIYYFGIQGASSATGTEATSGGADSTPQAKLPVPVPDTANDESDGRPRLPNPSTQMGLHAYRLRFRYLDHFRDITAPWPKHFENFVYRLFI